MSIRNLSKLLLLIGIALWVGANSGFAQFEGVSIDHVDGVRGTDSTKIPAGRPVTFYFRLNNQTGHDFACPSHGFKLSSPDGASWYPHSVIDSTFVQFPMPMHWEYDTTMYGEWVNSPGIAPAVWKGSDPQIFDGGLFVNTLIGTSADTVHFIGFNQTTGYGLYDGLNAVAFSIAIDSFPQSSIGKSFCIDSAYYRPAGGIWLWTNGIQLKAPWDGPYCFDIVDCCAGMRGNVEGDPFDEINLADLTCYVSWAYKYGPAPPCRSEVDMNGDGSIDTADLSYLVKYMFKGGAAPVACP
jgi:hypothetical protein